MASGNSHSPDEKPLILDVEKLIEHVTNLNSSVENLVGRFDDQVFPRRKSVDDDIENRIELKLPELDGFSNVKKYETWKHTVDEIFDLCEYSEEKKVKLAASALTGDALKWWTGLTRTRTIYTWEGLKGDMWERVEPFADPLNNNVFLVSVMVLVLIMVALLFAQPKAE